MSSFDQNMIVNIQMTCIPSKMLQNMFLPLPTHANMKEKHSGHVQPLNTNTLCSTQADLQHASVSKNCRSLCQTSHAKPHSWLPTVCRHMQTYPCTSTNADLQNHDTTMHIRKTSRAHPLTSFCNRFNNLVCHHAQTYINQL